MERLIWVFCFAGLPLVLGAGILWHLSVWQVLSLILGLLCFMLSWMVRRHGIIGYAYEHGFDPQTGQVRLPTTTVVRAPLPRVLAPLLTILGFAFLLAGTRTSVGAVLLVPVVAGVGVANLAKSAWDGPGPVPRLVERERPDEHGCAAGPANCGWVGER